MTPTQRFSDAFDASNKEHVEWLSKFFDYAKNIGSEKTPIDDFINTNPMGVKLQKNELLEWVHIHFCLAMKYSDRVMKGQAWIPNTCSK